MPERSLCSVLLVTVEDTQRVTKFASAVAQRIRLDNVYRSSVTS